MSEEAQAEVKEEATTKTEYSAEEIEAEKQKKKTTEEPKAE